ncbi:MAG: division/cell wall cluster transcriptional repressor MraZ [Flavobacteriales bacterium]|nr:division/cell wall cluster transcriptional repressor MraZ [Flavobacteriales bacterium]
MVSLIGTYQCKIDFKGRIKIPTPLQKQLLNFLSKPFVVKRSVFNKCIEVYPLEEWNVIVNQVNSLNRFVKKNNDFIRLFNAGVKLVDLDSNNRMLISKDLLQFADIDKNIVLSSSVNMIEVWDRDKYENKLLTSTPDFSKLAEEVMGDINKNQN